MSPVIDSTDLESRRIYSSSAEDLGKAVRATLTAHRLVNGVLEDEPVAVADMLHIQSINIADEERAQVVSNSEDSGKVYIYGRQPRVYTVSTFLVDSRRDRALRRWLRAYEDYFRLTACYRKGYIDRLRWRTSEFRGFLLSNVVSMESQNKSLWIVSFTFVHVSGYEDVDVPRIVDRNTRRSRWRAGANERDFAGFLSQEGMRRVTPSDYDEAALLDLPDPPVLEHIDARTRAAPI
jgi:hypothetical protein